MNFYREFKSSSMLRAISKESAENIYKIKDEEVKNRGSQYGNMIIIGLTIFVVSLALMSVRWSGLF
ncbi:hypothetical protein ABOONEI_745 [Aciduliprofundum boonei T469]|nr:hypothetical protein ABOONEI_745 [Aciduliprofundum boonei T469]